MSRSEDFTNEEIAKFYNNAINGAVGTINQDPIKLESESTNQFKSRIAAAVEHLELILTYKKADKTTSIWTTEDLAPINAAITKGKASIA